MKISFLSALLTAALLESACHLPALAAPPTTKINAETQIYNLAGVYPAVANPSGVACSALSLQVLNWQGTLYTCDQTGHYSIPASSGTAGVTSFNGRAGIVVPASGDYNLSQLTGTLTLSQTPLTTNQDILFDNGGTLGRLPIVSANNCLGNIAGAWSSIPCLSTSPLPVANGGNGTATPALTAGANVTLTGTWPNYTISSSASGGTVVVQQNGTNQGTAATLNCSTNLNCSVSGSVATLTATAGVQTFNGRSGAVVPVSGDYSFSLLSGSLLLAQTPLTTNQDLLFNSAGSLARLPIVSAGNCLGNSGGVWAGVACSGAAWATLAGGANTSAAMVVGSGASLTATGSGVLVANAVNLAASGNGGVTGILPKANGGTGTSSPALAAGASMLLTGTWPNNTIACQTASGSQSGCLSSSDWTTFNGKQNAGSYITALTGDGTASGPGSAAFTLATVNVTPGTYGDSTHCASLTVNGKGLVTSASQSTSCPGGGGGGFVNPMTTQGDIIVGGTSGAAQRLAAGTAGYVLTSGGAGTIPSWQAASGGGSTSSYLFLPFTVSAGTATFCPSAATVSCPLQPGNVLYNLTSPFSFSVATGSGSETVNVVIATDGTLTVVYPSASTNTYSCSGCTATTTTPALYLPLENCTVSSGTVSACTPAWSALGNTNYATTGPGVSFATVGGQVTGYRNQPVRVVTGTTDTLLSTDCGGIVNYRWAGTVGIGFPQGNTGGNFLPGKCPITLVLSSATTANLTISGANFVNPQGTTGTSQSGVNGTYDVNVLDSGGDWFIGYGTGGGSGSTSTYTPNGTGAVARTIAGKVSQYVDVIDFGADPTGTADNHTAFANAIAYACSLTNGATKKLLIPAGTYKLVSGVTVNCSNLLLTGDGNGSTIVDFEPTANGSAFTFSSGTSSEQYRDIVRDLSFQSVSGSNAYQKIAMTFTDCGSCGVEHVLVGNGTSWNSMPKASPTSPPSYPLQINGRDNGFVTDLASNADAGVVLGVDPNIATETLDHWTFKDIYLITQTYAACWDVANGVILTQDHWTGHQAWVGCNDGFHYWNDSNGTADASNGLEFNGVRTEQESPYSTGTVTTTGTTTVTGSGTSWNSNQPFHTITISGVAYAVKSVNSATSLTTYATVPSATGVSYSTEGYAFYLASTNAQIQDVTILNGQGGAGNENGFFLEGVVTATLGPWMYSGSGVCLGGSGSSYVNLVGLWCGTSSAITYPSTNTMSGWYVVNGQYPHFITPASGHLEFSTGGSNDVAGQISLSSTNTGSHSFSANYTNAPFCQLTPNTNLGSTTYYETTSTSAVTVNTSASTTATFTYFCRANGN